MKARENPQQGYMKRLKSLCDENYPTYNHPSEKHLREQASFIHSKTTRIDPPVGQEISSEETPHANEMNNNLNNSIINVIDKELALSFKKHFEHSLSTKYKT